MIDAPQDTPPRKPEPAAPVPALAPSPSRAALINAGLSVAQTIVITGFGFLVTGRLDQALKERQASLQERQATVQSVDKMTALLKAINESKTDDYLLLQSAFAQLAMYGSDAIFPLFVLAAHRSQFAPDNAITGLRLLAVQHPGNVCAVLLNAQKVPKSINEIRRKSIEDLTTEFGCGKRER